jgi:hypothetical protein
LTLSARTMSESSRSLTLPFCQLRCLVQCFNLCTTMIASKNHLLADCLCCRYDTYSYDCFEPEHDGPLLLLPVWTTLYRLSTPAWFPALGPLSHFTGKPPQCSLDTTNADHRHHISIYIRWVLLRDESSYVLQTRCLGSTELPKSNGGSTGTHWSNRNRGFSETCIHRETNTHTKEAVYHHKPDSIIHSSRWKAAQYVTVRKQCIHMYITEKKRFFQCRQRWMNV